MIAAKYTKPYYGIELNTNQVGVDIRLNDITTYYNYDSGQLNVDIPAPDSIIEGINELKIIAFTPFIDDENIMESFLPGASVSASFFIQEMDDTDNKKEYLAHLSISFDQNNLVKLAKSAVDNKQEKANIVSSTTQEAIVSLDFNTHSPFPRWAWQDGKSISNDEATKESLIAAYKKVYDALSNKDMTSLKELYQERAEEIAIAYHLGTTESGYKKLSVGLDMHDSSLELYTFWTKDMDLDIYANGKIARINNIFKSQPIIYIDRSAGALHKYKFGFYKNESDEWVMIR